MRRLPLVMVLLSACGGDDGSGWTVTGECDPPTGSADVATVPIALSDEPCFADGGDDLRVVGSEAEWNALFTCARPVPDGLDFATQRAAVVSLTCSPIDERFVVETGAEVVVGIYSHVSGACIRNIIVEPLARSTKPVRLARCAESCNNECPPVARASRPR